MHALICKKETWLCTSQRKKRLYLESPWSAFAAFGLNKENYFSSNAGKFGSGKLQIRTPFNQHVGFRVNPD